MSYLSGKSYSKALTERPALWDCPTCPFSLFTWRANSLIWQYPLRCILIFRRSDVLFVAHPWQLVLFAVSHVSYMLWLLCPRPLEGQGLPSKRGSLNRDVTRDVGWLGTKVQPYPYCRFRHRRSKRSRSFFQNITMRSINLVVFSRGPSNFIIPIFQLIHLVRSLEKRLTAVIGCTNSGDQKLKLETSQTPRFSLVDETSLSSTSLFASPKSLHN